RPHVRSQGFIYMLPSRPKQYLEAKSRPWAALNSVKNRHALARFFGDRLHLDVFSSAQAGGTTVGTPGGISLCNGLIRRILCSAGRACRPAVASVFFSVLCASDSSRSRVPARF